MIDIQKKLVVTFMLLLFICCSHSSCWFCDRTCFDVHYFVTYLICNHLAGEERANSFTLLSSRCHALPLPHETVGWL